MSTQQRKKTQFWAYALWLVTGWLGGHLWYLGQKKMALTRLALLVGFLVSMGITGFFALWLIVSWLLCVAVMVLWVIDTWRIPAWVDECNGQYRDALLTP